MEEWDDFLESMLSRAIREHHDSAEYEHWNRRWETYEEMLGTNLTLDQKELVEEILLEFDMTAPP